MAVMVDHEDEEERTIVINDKRFKLIIPMTPAAIEELDIRNVILRIVNPPIGDCTFSRRLPILGFI